MVITFFQKSAIIFTVIIVLGFVMVRFFFVDHVKTVLQSSAKAYKGRDWGGDDWRMSDMSANKFLSYHANCLGGEGDIKYDRCIPIIHKTFTIY
jgi:hypothetical protein